MKMLIYACSEFMTSDAVAVALLRYSEALAESQEAATIELPIVEPGGRLTTAEFLVGPASQIVSKNIETDLEEPDAPEVVERLRAMTRRLRPEASIESEAPSGNGRWKWED
jgi:hypothetical protein